MTSRFGWVLAMLLVAGCQAPAGAPERSAFEFALLGDNPYDDTNLGKYRRLIEHVNANPGLAWVVHLGDVKGGRARADQYPKRQNQEAV